MILRHVFLLLLLASLSAPVQPTTTADADL
jgi:hypothetical protein